MVPFLPLEKTTNARMELFDETDLDRHLKRFEAYTSNKECKTLLESLNAIFHHLTTTEKAFIIDERFSGCFQQLLLKALADLPQPNPHADLISCLATSFRICRNACAKFADNQTILRQQKDVLSLVKDLLVVLGSFVSLSEELLVLSRCAVQFIGNFSSGNIENQLIVVDMFFPVFRPLLQKEDEKLQQYTCIVTHTCLSGCLGNPEAHHRVTHSADCWALLIEVIKLCVDKEAPWGLYVIEDSCMYPTFCDNVYKNLHPQERVLVLEVLANHLKGLTEEDDKQGTSKENLPSISNLQHISDHCKQCARKIVDMHKRGDHETLESMVTVKELECLSLATAFHKSYGSLQEDTDLLKCCIGLLQAVDEIGRQGNNVFSSVEKITREGEVDPHHPVFGLKRDIIRLLGNMSYKHRKNQDLVRELEGLLVILNQSNIDGRNPFIIQWSLFAIHNLTEDNDQNKQYIAELKMQGVANNQAVLEDLGLEVRADGDRITVKKMRRS